jgi:hypothetical protein
MHNLKKVGAAATLSQAVYEASVKKSLTFNQMVLRITISTMKRRLKNM